MDAYPSCHRANSGNAAGSGDSSRLGWLGWRRGCASSVGSPGARDRLAGVLGPLHPVVCVVSRSYGATAVVEGQADEM